MRRNSLIRFVLCLLLVGMLFSTVSAVDFSDPMPEGYEELYPVETSAEAPVLYSSVESALSGKSILFYGDSLLAGYGLENYSDSWNAQLKTVYGMRVMNCAISGSTIAESDEYGYFPGGCYEPYVNRNLQQGAFDIVYVAGGGNDWYCEIPLGTDYFSRNTKTFIGAINTVIDKVQTEYPDALLLFSTSWSYDGKENGLGLTPNDYNNAMIEVCRQRGITCFEACNPNLSGVVPGNGMFLTGKDFWHLNAKGHAHYLPIIAGWLEDQLPEEPDYVGPFRDVAKAAWYAGAVEYVYKNGLMNGISETEFAPDTDTNRAMLVTILYRASGSPSVEGLSHPFTDTKEGEYYSDALLWAYTNQIVNGMGENLFAPSGTLTREQLATILYRMTGLPQAEADLTSFPDAEEISDYAKEAMAWAVEQGILQGSDTGELLPGGNATRAQIATILMRYLTIYPITA